MTNEKRWGRCRALHTQFLDPRWVSGSGESVSLSPNQNACGFRVHKHYTVEFPPHRVLSPLQQFIFLSKYPPPLSTGLIPLRLLSFPCPWHLVWSARSELKWHKSQIISPQMLWESFHASTIFPFLLPWNAASQTQLLHQLWSPNEERIE